MLLVVIICVKCQSALNGGEAGGGEKKAPSHDVQARNVFTSGNFLHVVASFLRRERAALAAPRTQEDERRRVWSRSAGFRRSSAVCTGVMWRRSVRELSLAQVFSSRRVLLLYNLTKCDFRP